MEEACTTRSSLGVVGLLICPADTPVRTSATKHAILFMLVLRGPQKLVRSIWVDVRHNGGVDAATRFHSSIAAPVIMRETLPPARIPRCVARRRFCNAINHERAVQPSHVHP